MASGIKGPPRFTRLFDRPQRYSLRVFLTLKDQSIEMLIPVTVPRSSLRELGATVSWMIIVDWESGAEH